MGFTPREIDTRLQEWEGEIRRHTVRYAAMVSEAELEDMRQECRIAVWKALASYDPARGPEEHYLRVCIANCLKMHCRGDNRRRAALPQVPLEDGDGGWEQDLVDDLAAKEWLRRVPSAPHRRMLSLLLQGCSGEDLLIETGWTPRQVRQRLRELARLFTWIDPDMRRQAPVEVRMAVETAGQMALAM